MGKVCSLMRGLLIAAACMAGVGAWATPPVVSCTTDTSVFNTGIDGSNGFSVSSPTLPIGSVDNNWEVGISTSGSAAFNPPPDPNVGFTWQPATVTGNQAPGAWVNSPFGNAQWIAWPNGQGSRNWQPIFYRYTFTLDPSVDPSTFNLNFDMYVDDLLQKVYVNGQLYKDFTPNNVYSEGVSGFSAGGRYPLLINQHWQAGTNTILLQTSNYSMPTGLLVQASGNGSCAAPISVEKTTTLTQPVQPGQAVPFTLKVRNAGTADASGTQLSDALPQGLASGTWSCQVPSGGAAACPTPASGSLPLSATLGQFPSGSELVFAINAVVDQQSRLPASGVITNTARLAAPAGAPNACNPTPTMPSPCESSASVSTGAVVALTKQASGSGPFYPGAAVSYTLDASNVGSVDASGTQISDTLPAGLVNGTWACQAPPGSLALCPSPASGSFTGNSFSQALAKLPGHSRLVFTVNAVVDPAFSGQSTVTNTAQLAPPAALNASCYDAATQASSAAPCRASADVVLSAVPAVSLAKQVNATTQVSAGQTLVYTVTATNTGTVAAPGAQLADALPAGIASGAWTCAASGGAACPAASGSLPLAASIATWPAGGSLVYTIQAVVDQAASGTIINTAVLNLDPGAGGTCNGSANSCSAQAASQTSRIVPPPTPASVPANAAWALLMAALGVLVAAARIGRTN